MPRFGPRPAGSSESASRAPGRRRGRRRSPGHGPGAATRIVTVTAVKVTVTERRPRWRHGCRAVAGCTQAEVLRLSGPVPPAPGPGPGQGPRLGRVRGSRLLELRASLNLSPQAALPGCSRGRQNLSLAHNVLVTVRPAAGPQPGAGGRRCGLCSSGRRGPDSKAGSESITQ